jgi:hypothetical protein
MSSIPGAHASLGFGRKRVDFYASPGVTGESGRRGEHEIRDADGETHNLRLSRPDTPLESGETVTVLRAQSGPDHDSRPVSVINHDRNAWTRTSPDATSVLARSGITRATSWWLSMFVFMIMTVLFAWPDIRLFMLEVDPALFAALPEINVFAMAADRVPALQGYDLAAAIPGLSGLVEQAGLPGWITPNVVAFTVPLLLLALVTYFSRSWRVIWVPVYVAAATAAGLALGVTAPLTPTMLALGGIALVFCLGGFINRTRDASRLEGRIARLSENILRHPPAETVIAPAAVAAVAVSSDDAPADDDLPSDEELAAARIDADAPVDEDVEPTPSLRASEADATLEVEDTSDRDMLMPPPPPLATPTVNDSAESGEAENTEDASPDPEPAAEAVTPVPVAIEPSPETPEPEAVHGLVGGDETQPQLASSRDIVDEVETPIDVTPEAVDDMPEDTPHETPDTPRTLASETADGDAVDPFMTPAPVDDESDGEDTPPRQTDS